MKKILRSLFNWHLLLAFIYFVQIALFYYFIDSDLYKSLDLVYLSQNLLTGELQTTVKTVYDLNLKHVLPIVLMVGGLLHLHFGLRKEMYQRIVSQKVNIWRWLNGGIVLSLMLSLTALLLGIHNLTYLLLLGGSMLVFGWLGLLTEYIAVRAATERGKTRQSRERVAAWSQLSGLIFSLQKITGLFAWLLVGASLLGGSVLAAESFGLWNYLIYLSGLLLVALWLFIVAAGRKGIGNRRDHSRVEVVHYTCGLFVISIWVWSIALTSF